MEFTNQLKNQHLLWRAGFGPMAEDLTALTASSQKSFTNALWKASARSVEPIMVADNVLKGLAMGVGEITQRKDLSPEEKRRIRQQSQQDLKSLNLAWLGEMVNTDAQLREKMALFWHGHFASRNLNIYYQQLLLDTIRQGALGNFGDLLRGVSKSAAMINFLNNNQNRKDHPNENFAREVMELFTIGRGNYTEHDVKESARAFTGWGATLSGEFQFRKGQHDDGQKTVLGKTGNLDGDAVLDILLEQRQTALFITRKLWRYLVNDEVDEARVEWLAGRFYQSNYDIKGLLLDIFDGGWFYDSRNIGSRIKSPVDLLVGIRRLLPMKIANEQVQLLIQRLLGQLLFYPPNVAGWPGGASWIDSSSLMFRLRLPELIYASGEFQQQPKDDDDQMMGMKDRPMGEAQNAAGVSGNTSSGDDQPEGGDRSSRRFGGGKFGKGRGAEAGAQMIRAEIDWAPYLKRFDGVSREQLPAAVGATVLQTASGIGADMLKKYTDNDSREGFIKTATIRLMSTPEYQLC
ncbi:MAG TPA: DUF1800 domain-containing protein [Puia sp.]|nr:DUF1800 domain-containing protein [Puia sp.]